MQVIDVTIIGAGPVGLALAIELAQRGICVTLVEKHHSPQHIPKGQNLTQRSGEHFRAWGVSAAIRAATPIPPEYGNEGLVAYGSLLSGYHYDWFKRASVREFYAADNERLPQYESENVLRKRVAELSNIDVLTGWEFQHFEDCGDEINTTIVESTGIAKRVLTSTYLIGCDGARSGVREAAGITQTQDEHDRRMALLVFQSSELHQLLDTRFPRKTIFNAIDPEQQGYWQFLGRVDLENNWFFHAPVPADSDKNNYDFKSLLHRAVGAEFSVSFDHIGFWDLRFSQADTYQSGRVFIAGDAAHSHPPYGGYGVNTGFEDARNLGWKMSAVIQGQHPPCLLSSYTLERHPVFASTRDNFIARMIRDDERFVASYNPDINKDAFEIAWQDRASGGQSAVVGYVPHYRGSPIVYETQGDHSLGNSQTEPGATGVHSHVAKSGTHLSPQILSSGQDVYAQLGNDYTLILIDIDDDTGDRFAKAAATASIALSIVTSTNTEGTDRWEASIILVRPDQFIAFAANQLDVDPAAIFSKCSGESIK